jgi:hypothetical protein
VNLVHGSWTTGTPVHHGLASIADRRSSFEIGLQPLWGSRPMTKGRGGGSGARGTRWAAHLRPGNSEAAKRWRKVVAAEGLRWEHALVREMRQGGWCGVK